MSNGLIMGSGEGAYDADVAGEFEELREAATEMHSLLHPTNTAAKRQAMQQLKEEAEAEPKGAKVDCPVCRTPFFKKHPRQAFCNKDRRHRCKNQYHNTVDDKRRARAERWMAR